jgi:hypothetical protein
MFDELMIREQMSCQIKHEIDRKRGLLSYSMKVNAKEHN